MSKMYTGQQLRALLLEALERLTNKFEAVVDALPDRPSTITPVFVICNAYESGFGHGLEDDKLVNPYTEGTNEREAYDIGYDEGKSRRKP